MTEKTYNTKCGVIHYWVSDEIEKGKETLVFLPGLTADHRLFDRQVEYFSGKYNLFTWDAPGHNMSRPFELSFDLMDKACWLFEILAVEDIRKPFLIGQSMGGYVGQAFMQLFPDSLSGFISIDSAPLKREYMKDWEIKALKKCELMYRWYPWKLLLRDGVRGTAETEYGRKLMREMMMSYADDPGYYARLAGHGYRMLAEAIEADLSYEIYCPALLICGEKDKAGEAKKYNKEWTKRSGIPLVMIKGAGHNANTDRPDIINPVIEEFVEAHKGGK
ncbi:MAG: alpha/beta hydrolase [Lachnospiraceae bacterium]|nr:alpha/beta hydrolase [Lachnospiraceae bacterium]